MDRKMWIGKGYGWNRKQKEWPGILGTIFLSIVLFLIIGNGNLNFGLFDDNQSQWLPVIDRALQSLLDTGKLPTIDFFQMKGMKIYDQGYYGLWNPFMLIAYLIRTCLLFFLPTNTISVYILMMIILGNLCCYGIFRRYEIPSMGAVLLSSCMMSVSVYVALSYWYYIYNVYFILSWLLLRLLQQEDKRSYYEYGAILALSLLMGNVQYTVYMFLAFALIMSVLFLRGDRRAPGKLLSNGVCMGILSAVPLLLLLQASARTINFSGNNAEYYSSAVHALVLALFSWIPSFALGDMAEKAEGFLYANIPFPDAGVFPGARSMYMGAVVCAAVVFLFCKKKYKKGRLFETAYACLLSAGVLLLLSFGKAGLLAVFARQIPFMDSFRMIAKYLVLIPLLLLPCMAVVVGEQKSFWNRYTALFLFFMLFGIVHNRQIALGTSQIQTDESVERLEELGVDYGNYRVLGFASLQEIQVSYPQWEEFVRRERISYEEKFSKNAGTAAGILTQGGYDLAFDYRQYEMSDAMLGTMSGYASEFGYDNMVIEDYFLEGYQRDSSDYAARLSKLRGQILDNSVKYFIFTKDSACYPVFLRMLTDMHISLEWQQPFLEHTVILAAADIPSVVQGRDSGKINAHVTMDRISFSADGNHEFRIGMYYDENLRAVYMGEDGQERAVSVLPDEKGYFLVSGIPDRGYGTVEISYENSFYQIGKLWNTAALLLILAALFLPEAGGVKRAVSYMEGKVKVLAGHMAVICPHRGVTGCFLVLLCLYAGFMGVYYLHTGCTVPDEDWFLQMFRTIHHKAQGDFFAYLGGTENYLGYGQLYWMVGGLLPHILPLRIMMYILLMGSLFFMLKEIQSHFGKQMIPYAGILWISMPYAWYADKCIGPEIPGLFLGILGLYLLHRKRGFRIGWILLGISSGIKMNYAVFLLVAFAEALWRAKREKGTAVVRGIMFGVCGFMMANPILLWDLPVYMENMALGSRMTPEMLSYVFERREREWDGVIVNGIFWGYVSAFLLFAAVMIPLIRRAYSSADPSLPQASPAAWRSSVSYGKLAGCVCLVLVGICCREIFLGWYLLPLCYLAVVFICGSFYEKGGNRQIRNLLYWAFAFCLFLNALILMPENLSHRRNNTAYMRVEANGHATEEETAEVKAVLEKEKPDIPWYYLLDFHMGEYSYNFKDYADFCVSNVDGIAVIGERMRCIAAIDEIVEKAENKEENLNVLWRDEDVWIVERVQTAQQVRSPD